jgi:hypothetical protein
VKQQKRDAFYEYWIWLEAKKKLTTVFSFPHMVFAAVMICVRTVWAVALQQETTRKTDVTLKVTSLAKAETAYDTTYFFVHRALVGMMRTEHFEFGTGSVLSDI